MREEQLRMPPRPRSLSDIDRSTAANDPRPSASFSARKNPQCIPANTPPVFPDLRPRIWPHLLRLATKAMSDRLLLWGFLAGESYWQRPLKHVSCPPNKSGFTRFLEELETIAE